MMDQWNHSEWNIYCWCPPNIPPQYILLPICCLYGFVISKIYCPMNFFHFLLLFSLQKLGQRGNLYSLNCKKKYVFVLKICKYARSNSAEGFYCTSRKKKKKNIGQQNNISLGLMWMWICPMAFSCVDAASRQENADPFMGCQRNVIWMPVKDNRNKHLY